MPIAFVRQDAFSQSTGTAISVTLGVAPVVTNVVICGYGTVSTGPHVTSIVETNATWAVGKTSNVTQEIEGWVGRAAASAGTGVVINLGADLGGTFCRVNFSEFSGVSSTVVASAASTGTGNTTTTGSITPAAGSSVLLWAMARRGNGATAFTGFPSGWTVLTTSSGIVQYAYLIVTSASGSYSATWTAGDSFNWDTVIFSLPATAGGALLSESRNSLVIS